MTDKPKDQEIKGSLFVNQATFGGEMRTAACMVDDQPLIPVQIVWENSGDVYTWNVNEDKPNG